MKIKTNHTVVLTKDEIKKLIFTELEVQLSGNGLALPVDFTFFWEGDSQAAIIEWKEKDV